MKYKTKRYFLMYCLFFSILCFYVILDSIDVQALTTVDIYPQSVYQLSSNCNGSFTYSSNNEPLVGLTSGGSGFDARAIYLFNFSSLPVNSTIISSIFYLDITTDTVVNSGSMYSYIVPFNYSFYNFTNLTLENMLYFYSTTNKTSNSSNYHLIDSLIPAVLPYSSSSFTTDLTNIFLSSSSFAVSVQSFETSTACSDIDSKIQVKLQTHLQISYDSSSETSSGSPAGSPGSSPSGVVWNSTLSVALNSWNPSIYPQLVDQIHIWLNGTDLNDFFTNAYRVFYLFVQYVLREPGSLAGNPTISSLE